MTRLEWLTYEHFAGRAGEDFGVDRDDGESVRLELAEATEGTQPGGRGGDGQQRQQFSLVFRGPQTPILRQGTYRLSHPDLGELELFLVPIGADAAGAHYEAAFA